MNLEEAIQHAIDGRAILFIGAGFSFGATNIYGKPIPAGKMLTAELLTSIEYEISDVALDKASAAYLRRNNRDKLVNFLIPRFSVRNVTNSHEVIASLPWRHVYTTNYDMVFEKACQNTGKPCTPVEGVDEPRSHLKKQNLVVHINGQITRLTEASLDSSFKLISQSYAADSFENSGWAFHFRNDIRTATAIVFVGYSMYDLDVKRILFSEDISTKCVFVVAPPLSPKDKLDVEELSDLGVVASIGVDAFAETVKAVKKNYLPQKPELLLEYWQEVSLIQSSTSAPSDADVLNFLVAGTMTPSLLLESYGPNVGSYFITRTSLPILQDELSTDGGCSAIIADLGTGKSFICDTLAQVFMARGWRVFKLERESDDEITEAQAICAISGTKLLIIENYPGHLDLLKWFSETNPQDTALAITARTNTHELFADELYDIFGGRLRIHDVSELEPQEIDSAIDLFDRYGLWGERSRWGRERKKRFIRNDCAEYLPSLLVDVIESQHITVRYRDLVAKSANRAEIEELLICAFVLEVIGFTPRISYIQELIGNRVRWSRLHTQGELRLIVDFKANTVRAKSSVLAFHLLTHIFSATTIVKTLIGMTKEAETRHSDRDYHSILNSLMRYHYISLVMPSENRLASTINFYEGVKNLPAARRNPQFWLQYAIACLAFGKLDRAERYFQDAYSYAPPGYNTYQIDNHYARLLLEKALVVNTMVDAVLLVDDAKKILFQQINREKRYYPYRVALGLFRCYERFLASWTVEQRNYFLRIFEELQRKCQATTVNLRNNRYVTECIAKAKSHLEK